MGSTQSQKLPTSKVPGGSASGAIRGSDFLSGSPLTDLPTPPSPPAGSLLATPSSSIMRDGLVTGGLDLSAPLETADDASYFHQFKRLKHPAMQRYYPNASGGFTAR